MSKIKVYFYCDEVEDHTAPIGECIKQSFKEFDNKEAAIKFAHTCTHAINLGELIDEVPLEKVQGLDKQLFTEYLGD